MPKITENGKGDHHIVSKDLTWPSPQPTSRDLPFPRKAENGKDDPIREHVQPSAPTTIAGVAAYGLAPTCLEEIVHRDRGKNLKSGSCQYSRNLRKRDVEKLQSYIRTKSPTQRVILSHIH